MLLVGVFPMDGDTTLHAIGAVLYLVGGVSGSSHWPTPSGRGRGAGRALALLGLIGTAATILS